jgi:hypothetical protein
VIHLRLTRDPTRKGCTNEWTCAVIHHDTGHQWRGGLGRDRTEALGSFFRANLTAFDVAEIEDVDPEEADRVVTWKADRQGE